MDFQYVKEFASSKGMNTGDFFKSCDINKQQLSLYKNGTFYPSKEVIKRIKTRYPDFNEMKLEKTNDGHDYNNSNLNTIDLLQVFKFTTENLVKMKDEVVQAKQEIIDLLKKGMDRAEKEADYLRSAKTIIPDIDFKAVAKDLSRQNITLKNDITDVKKMVKQLVDSEA